MRIIETIVRSGVAVAPDRPVHEVAAIMEQAGVGSLAVVDDGRLVGIVTDRDLVRRALARRLPCDVRVDSVMTAPVVTVDGDAEFKEVFELFATHAVRRLAVTRDGAFAGMITVDDLLVTLSAQLSAVARPVTAELLFGHHEVPVPSPR